MSKDPKTPLLKATEKVIAILKNYPTWTKADQKEFMRQNRQELTKLRLVIRGALAEEKDAKQHSK